MDTQIRGHPVIRGHCIRMVAYLSHVEERTVYEDWGYLFRLGTLSLRYRGVL